MYNGRTFLDDLRFEVLVTRFSREVFERDADGETRRRITDRVFVADVDV